MGNGLQVYSPYHLRAKKGKYTAVWWSISSVLCFLLGLGLAYTGYLDKIILPLSKQLDIEVFKARNLGLLEQQTPQSSTGLGEAQLSAKVRLLQAKNLDLKQAKAKVEKQLHMLQSTSQVNQIAVKGSQETLKQMQEELASLKGELSIYQRLSSTGNQKNNLNIQNFTLSKELSTLKFQLILSKGTDKNTIIKGDAYISAQGSVNGTQRILNLAEISPGSSNSLHFQFRFFQVLNGTLQWPDGFEPKTLFIRVIPTSKGSQEISQRWDWIELLAKADKQ